MSKNERELLEKLIPFGIFTWDHALCVRNGAKTITTRWSRNVASLHGLILHGKVRKASREEIAACEDLFKKHTDRIKNRLLRAAANENWTLTRELADKLSERKFSKDIYVIAN